MSDEEHIDETSIALGFASGHAVRGGITLREFAQMAIAFWNRAAIERGRQLVTQAMDDIRSSR